MTPSNQLYRIVVVLIALIVSHGVFAASSNSYVIVQDRINSGGNTVAGGGYIAVQHIGQPGGGQINSAFYQINAGYLHALMEIANKLGDINGDDMIDLKDVISALQVLTGGNLTELSTTGDVDGNNKIGLEEVLYDLNEVAK